MTRILDGLKRRYANLVEHDMHAVFALADRVSVLVSGRTIGADYGRWARPYQSRYVNDKFTETNAKFQNVTFTDDVEGDREKSLLAIAGADVHGA
jgi:ABC-type sugar transport system ATPase subunit